MGEETIAVRLAGVDDLAVVGRGELPEEIILRKIRQGEIILLCVNDEPVGYLWFALLWSTLPFVDLIYINEACQKRGLSRILLSFLEDHLRERGHTILYSSSQMNKPEPQSWHRRMGFEECGVINGMNDGGIGELFFRKAL